MKTLLLIIIAMSLLLFACGGSDSYQPEQQEQPDQAVGEVGAFIVALGYVDTIAGMRAASLAQPGTFVLSNDDILMFVWQQRGYPAFAMIEMTSRTPIKDFALNAGGNGTVADLKSMGKLVGYLQDNGWKTVPPGQVPKWIVEALATESTWLSLTSIEFMPTFIVIPVGEDPTNFIDSLQPPEIIQ